MAERDETSPRVSVIIPVFNDADRLRICLEALESQTFADPFEIIVVDNDSSDEPDAVVASSPRAQLLREPRRSSYAARNRGAAAARGEVLAFIDSDCIPGPDWLLSGVRCLEASPEPAFVGGEVDAFPQDPDRPTAVELYETVHAFPMKRYLEELSFAGAGNLFITAAVFEAVGGFNGSLKSNGDREFGERACRAGVRPVYSADARVTHPARRSFEEMRTKNRRRIEGAEALRALGTATSGTRLRRIAKRALLPPVRSTLRNLPKLEPQTARSKLLYFGSRLAIHYTSTYYEARTLLHRRREGRRQHAG